MINLKLIKLDYVLLIIGYIILGITSLAVISVPALFFLPSQIGTLGVCLSLQFILSQLFGSGFHFSALYYKSVSNSTQEDIYCTINSKLNVTVVSVLMGTIMFFSFPLLSNIYDNFLLDDFRFNLILSTVFIAINRVLFSELNASKKFATIGKLYIAKSAVYLLILTLMMLKIIDFKQYVNCQLLVPELIIYLYYAFIVIKHFSISNDFQPFRYFKRDMYFGIKSIWGTIFLEASTKVDVLMLGVFVSPEKVGIYSIISMISDLFLNISTAIRTFINPDITLNFINNRQNFIKFIIQKVKFSYQILLPIIACIIFSFYTVTNFIPKYYMYKEGFFALVLLCMFLALVSGFIPLMLTFGQIGKPNLQSINFLVLFLANVLLNYLLIPLYGIEGASIATGLSYLIYTLFFRTLLHYTKTQN
ncbi:MAG TPA: polysaccharide biosynthesis C-terminal domain-containing protein [Flavobacterium sp.]|uniref:oligosaccharide flippase family protein n=1 Tax=Flavobacterium sp. TaxID=239 RepID=UPI002C9B093E|nr:polysaccharide biosynthesis C-terminal domain-containing protein [Flavobacterium sp.]HNP32559.1 polysaccharide biosynthesis C-terminal domain-containing protein [Flavobacterium sp.]